MLDFKPRFCDKCGEPKNKLENGIVVITRCTCDWEIGAYEQGRLTVHPDFLNGWTLKDWNPGLFVGGGNGIFRNLIKIQKACAIKALYEFCFKIIQNDPTPGRSRYSLFQSMDRGKTLFIRGPNNSGRGCLMATIKMFCAFHDISTTPNPGDWSTFKSEVLQSEWNSKEADMAKLLVNEQYLNVKVLALEHVRGEGQLSQGERFPRRPFRGCNVIDSILTRRTFQKGCMLFTSAEFIKEIGDTVGDKLPDILESEHTSTILMFSPAEADALLDGVMKRLSVMRVEAHSLANSGKGTLQTQFSEERAIESLKEALFLETAFPTLEIEGSIPIKDKIDQDEGSQDPKFSAEVYKTYAEFNKNVREKNLAYDEGMKKAYQSAVIGCKELAFKMSQRELIQTGKMMSEAYGSVASINKIIEDARQIREVILTQKAPQ